MTRRAFRWGAVSLAVLAMATLAAIGGSRTETARAAGCGAGACMRVDAVPGGGIDATASVGGNFTVDIVLQGAGSNVGAFNFNLAYNPSILGASAPTTDGLPSAALNCALAEPTGTADQAGGGADGDPATAEAFISCFSENGATIGDGVIAHVAFSAVAAGTSPLRLIAVAVSDNDFVTRVNCDIEGNAYGGCSDANVSTTGGGSPLPPPPAPAAGNQCAVASVIDGETVQCADGSRVRFIGVASPLGSDPGAGWATALSQWFLAGKTMTLEQDATASDQFGSRLAYPHVTGSDGNDYNISALLIYVGMAHHLSDGVNVRNDAWFDAAQVWARTACWNMWSAGNPFGAESGCR